MEANKQLVLLQNPTLAITANQVYDCVTVSSKLTTQISISKPKAEQVELDKFYLKTQSALIMDLADDLIWKIFDHCDEVSAVCLALTSQRLLSLSAPSISHLSALGIFRRRRKLSHVPSNRFFIRSNLITLSYHPHLAAPGEFRSLSYLLNSWMPIGMDYCAACDLFTRGRLGNCGRCLGGREELVEESAVLKANQWNVFAIEESKRFEGEVKSYEEEWEPLF